MSSLQRLWVGFLFWRSIATVILKSKWTLVCRGYLPGRSVLCLMSSPEFNIHVSHGLAAVKNPSYTVRSLGSKWHFAAVLDLVSCDVYEEAVRKVPLDRVPWASSRLWPYKSRSYTWTMCFQLAVSLSDSSLARTTAANYFGHYRSYSTATCIMPCSWMPQLRAQERCCVLSLRALQRRRKKCALQRLGLSLPQGAIRQGLKTKAFWRMENLADGILTL